MTSRAASPPAPPPSAPPAHRRAPARPCSTPTRKPRSNGSWSGASRSTKPRCDNPQIRNALRYTLRTEITFERILMKRAIAIILETILFLFVFLAGSLLVAVPAAHLPSWNVNLSGPRYFVLEGVVFMLILYLLVLLLGAARH